MKSTEENTSLELEEQVDLGKCSTNSAACLTLNKIQEHTEIQDTNEIISSLSAEITKELAQTDNLSNCIDDQFDCDKSTNNEEQAKDYTQKEDNPNLSDFNFDDSAADDILGILQIEGITNDKMFDKMSNAELHLKDKDVDNSKTGDENYDRISNMDLQEITELIDTELPTAIVSTDNEIQNQEMGNEIQNQETDNEIQNQGTDNEIQNQEIGNEIQNQGTDNEIQNQGTDIEIQNQEIDNEIQNRETVNNFQNEETDISTEYQLKENNNKDDISSSSLETNKELESNSCIHSDNQIERNEQKLSTNNSAEIIPSPELQTKTNNLDNNSSNKKAEDCEIIINNQKNDPTPLVDDDQNNSELITDFNKTKCTSVVTHSRKDKDESDDETTIKLKKAVKIAINELLQSVIGKHDFIAKCKQDNKSSKNETMEITRNVENKDMQNITKSAICALFKRSYSNNSENHRPDGQGKPTLLQHIIQSEISETSTKTIQSILNEIRILPNKDMLLLYLKLLSKCKEMKSAGNTTLPNPITSNSQLEKLLRAPISSSSKTKVESIIDNINFLTPTEYLFLHLNLPKWKKKTNDLQSATVRCGAIISQSIMWLKTSFELNEFSMIPKQNVYIKYQLFCQRNKLKPISTSDFGKMVKKIYPGLTHRRQVVKGKPYYNYGGLKYRFELPIPHLPKLSEKGKIQSVLFSCHDCCEIYSYMHNLKSRSKPLKDPSHSSTKKLSIKRELTNKNNTLMINLNNYSNNHYKSSIIDGKKILVHDPLELLSVSTKNKDHATSDVKTNFAKRKLLSKNNLFKIKYKPYRHPSIIKLFKEFQNIILPYEVYKSNVNPVIVLNNTNIINYCAIRIKNLMNKLDNLNIREKSDSNIQITCTCCNKLMDKYNCYGEKLLYLKKNMPNIKINLPTKDLNYRIMYKLYNEQLTKATDKKNDIFNQIAYKIIKQSHISVQKVLQNYSNLTLPESVLKNNICPVVLLDKQIVLKWYQDRVSCLKEKLVVLQAEKVNYDNICEINYGSQTTNVTAPRQSRAKLMNFCEIDSNFSDSDNDILNKDKILQKATLQQNVLQTNNFLDPQNRKRAALDNTDTIENVEMAKKRLCINQISNITMKEPEIPKLLNNNGFFNNKEFRCTFCFKQFFNRKEMLSHERTHLRCKSCNYKFKNVTVMKAHLVKHCTINTAIKTPSLKLHRVDTVKMIVKKYPDAFEQLKLEIKANRATMFEIAKTATVNPTSTSTSKQQIGYTTKRLIPNIKFRNIYPTIDKIVLPTNSNNPITLRQPTPNLLHIVNQPTTSDNVVYQPTIRQAPFQLKNTISNNLNKILLLSSNTVATSKSSPSSNVLYGLYVTNTSNTFNKNQNTSDCALNTFPSCSNLESTNFMQIVETPNPTIIQYSPKIPESTGSPFEHQDHSYHQPLYINESIPTSNNMVMVNDVLPKSFEIPPINTSVIETPRFPSPIINSTNQPPSINTPPAPIQPGPFRIRVKNISELS